MTPSRLLSTVLLVALAVAVLVAAPQVAERTLGAPTPPRPAGPVDDVDPQVARLDKDLLEAVRRAIRDARDEGVNIEIVSGWRSRQHQQRLFDEAVATYGSEEEAGRWVASPETSAHVTGDAVDIGPTEAAYWMSEHGSAYGLCQTFANEVWHYELATEPGGTCPEMYADSSERD